MRQIPSDSPWTALQAAPLLPVAMGLIGGIVLDRFGQFSAFGYTTVFIVVCALAIPRSVRSHAGPVLVLIASICYGGAINWVSSRLIPAASIERFVGDDRSIARIRGTVSSEPRVLSASTNPFEHWTYGTDRTAFLLDVESIEGLEGDIEVTGRVRVTVREVVLELRENDVVELFGWLYRMSPPRNPGSFDWTSFYRRQGVVAGFSCDRRENLKLLFPQTTPRARPLVWLRTTVRGMLTDDLATGADEEASLLEAMILGHRSQLDRRLNQVFVQAGCIHFLAVSGIHVVIVMFLARLVVGLFSRSPRTHVWAMIVAVVVYALIAEPRPPILRATVIALLYCIARLLGRDRTCLNWISASAIVLAVAAPAMIFDIGFQLSFAAVIGVSYLNPAIQSACVAAWKKRRGWPSDLHDEAITRMRPRPDRGWVRHAVRWFGRYVAIGLSVAAAAWLATMPIVAVYFGRIQPWGGLNTMLVLPLVTVVMGLGFAKLVIGVVSPAAGALVATVLVMADSLLVWVVENLAGLPGASITMAAPPSWWIVAYYLALVLFAWRFRPCPFSLATDSAAPGIWRFRPVPLSVVKSATAGNASPAHGTLWEALHRPRWERPACSLAAVLLLISSVVWAWPKSRADELRITALAVGAGTATVVELPDGQTVLYDAGSMSPPDVGRGTVVPFLRHRGIHRIDRVYLGHPNLDHFSGLPSILDEIETGPIIVNEHFVPLSPPGSPSWHFLNKELARRGRAIEVLDPSTKSWNIGGVTFERLWPTGNLDESLSSNDSSMVLRLSYAGRSILLTGDIGASPEEVLAHRGNLRSDVLLLPHHGGSTRRTGAFISAVDPSTLVCSSSRRMGETAQKLADVRGSRPLLDTGEVGAVEMIIDSRDIRVAGFLAPGRD
ncbi:MAG: ComEC/Rec2 family competence protein [Planctomycetes bacterium]|nr:ComEC/Rec2 family competence protein [Planctomycetota bacterium]